MRKIITKTVPFYYEANDAGIVLGDSFQILRKIEPESVDMIFAGPPYFLSSDEVMCQGGKTVSVNKGSWDRLKSENRKGTEEKHKFDKRWVKLCKRVLKPNETIWVSGALYDIYSIGMALEQEDFKIINNITWQKTNPPPSLTCRCFTHSTEAISQVRKDEEKCRHFFDYSKMKEMSGGKQMKNVWVGNLTKLSKKSEGKYPTQKPEYLLGRIVLASTEEGQVVLDPFCSSDTTGSVTLKHNRKFIGIDNIEEYLQITQRRLEKAITNKKKY